MKDTKRAKILFNIITIIITILLIIFIIYGIKIGILQDKLILVNYIKKFGIIAPLIFILFQAFQVVLPIIPGGASCLAGVLAFGSIGGFIYNYIGLIIGSILAFYLSRKYGISLVEKLFKEDSVNKYLKYIQTSKFNKLFLLGIFLPGLPDDLLCYIAGISKLKFKYFLLIIILGKPLSLILYSIFMELF